MNKRAAVAVAVAALAGCELIVPSSLPTYSCGADTDGACPVGYACDLASGTCLQGAVPGDDGPSDDGGDDARGDARADADSGPTLLDLGEACRVDNDCKSKLCGTSTTLTTSITATGPICTETCCTSNDCPSSFVCFNGGTGGGYCVPAVKAQRSPPATGGAAAGAACVGSGDCRSGLCSNMKCLDTCCVATDCAAGTTCAVGSISAPPPAHDEWVCIPPVGVRNVGTSCTQQTDCKVDNCVGFAPEACTPSCCKPSDCAAWAAATTPPAPNGATCAYGLSGSDQLKWCFQVDTARNPLNATCNASTECQSAYCDPELKKCLEVCCKDSDCGSGNICKPSATNTPFLRCVPGSR
ncbi:MAG TPA: hypothetical protein VIF62_05065 [Labilithrix sp.]|jgi:hypothetical protein